jgi:hypothetical protein
VRIALVVLLAVHGLVHVAGFLKAFGFAELAGLAHPLSRGAGALWLAAAVAFLASAVVLLVDPRHWWIAAAPALLLSQALIVADHRDAKVGTLANALVLVPLLLALADLRPSSLRSRYEVEAREAVAAASSGALERPVTEADLAPLPDAVKAYLRRAGAVGAPRVRSLQATFRARLRRSPGEGWMSGTVEQVDVFGAGGARRLFYMEASRLGVPFLAFHRYVGDTASMQVRVAGLVEVVDARGPLMTRGETVTLFNDLVVLAPGALVDAPVRWQALGPREVRAAYTNAGQTISATLTFDAAGDLVGFVSDDRYQSDGRTYRLLPWSTPLGDYRCFGGVRVAARGEARWREPFGEWTYGQFELKTLAYNPRSYP